MHSGGSGGFASEFRRYPEKGYTIIVLSNYAWGGFELTNAIEALMLDLPYEVATEADRWYRKGMDLQRVDAFRQATVCFEKNIEILPPHLPSLYQAARSRILGEYEQARAIELLDRYIGLADENTQPSIAAAHWRKGVAYEQLNEVNKAIACYRESLDHDETFSQAQEALQQLEKSE
jgi:tetratricopeptide (TPR) repeat protein